MSNEGRHPDREMDAHLRALAETAAGSNLETADWCGWDHGESRVWDCRFADGSRLFLKEISDTQKLAQEVRAYRDWAPLLVPMAPRLVALDEAARALVLSPMAGEPAYVMALDPGLETELHLQAGEVLARLHRIPYEDDDIPLSEAIVLRAEQWARRAGPHVPRRALDSMQAQIRDVLPLLEGARRCPCHRDFSPRNWIVDSNRRLRIIDFGHSRPDLWLADVERLWSHDWVGRPHLSSAFWSGYGRSPGEDDTSVLAALSTLAAISTIAWAREHRDRSFEQRGREQLRRALDPRRAHLA